MDVARSRSFMSRSVVVAPGEVRPHDEEEWRGALIVIDAGELELRCHAGGSRRFGTGAVLWFTGLNLAALYNPGTEPAVFRGIIRTGPGSTADPA